MQKRKRFQGWIALCVMFLCMASTTFGQEKILADYFDIPVNSPEGTEVIGRVHLERNKDVLSRPIPEGYHFEILKGEGLFTLETQYDLSKRLMGVFKVAKGKNTGETPSIHRLTIALKDGNRVLQKTNIKIQVAKETLLKKLYTRYAPQVIKNSRLYGRMKPSDEEVATLIEQLKNNSWKFPGLEKCYERRPQDYPKKAKKGLLSGILCGLGMVKFHVAVPVHFVVEFFQVHGNDRPPFYFIRRIFPAVCAENFHKILSFKRLSFLSA